MAGPDWTRHGDLIARPFGHCHDAPVVRRIGDRQLFLGNVHAADPARWAGPLDGVDPERRAPDFDAVLSLTRGRQPATTDHRPMVDGPNNDWAAFESAADAAVELAKAGSLLIHCSHGISRSAAVVSAVVAVSDGRPFRAALSAVRRARPPAVVHPALFEQALIYVAGRTR